MEPLLGKTYKIVVACGTAIATSTHVAIKLKEMLEEQGISIQTIQCRVQEVPIYADDADLVLATAQVPYDIDKEVVNAIPFLTGIGLEEVIEKIKDILLNS